MKKGAGLLFSCFPEKHKERTRLSRFLKRMCSHCLYGRCKLKHACALRHGGAEWSRQRLLLLIFALRANAVPFSYHNSLYCSSELAPPGGDGCLTWCGWGTFFKVYKTMLLFARERNSCVFICLGDNYRKRQNGEGQIRMDEARNKEK